MKLQSAMLMVLPLLGGCSLEAAMTTCAQCGQVRSIAPREITPQIRLPTDAPRAVAATRSGVPVVYDVRIRMDRGGSLDVVLVEQERVRLRVGDRVEIRHGRVVPLARVSGLGLT